MDNTADLSLTTLLNALKEFVWLRQPSGRMDFMNEAAQAALGVGLSDMENDSGAYLRYIVAEDLDRVVAAGRAATERAVEVEFRVQLPRSDAHLLRARVFPLHGRNGEVTAVMGIAKDITAAEGSERLRKELSRARDERDQAKSSEGELRAIMDRITDGFFAIDREWRILYVNQRFEELLQLRAEDILGKTLLDVFPEARGSVFHVEYQRAFQNNVTVEFEGFWEPLQAWYEIHAYPSDEGLSVFLHDVTEKRRLEMELVEATARERRRVGAELHDSVGQKLTGASLLIRALEARVAAGATVEPSEVGSIAGVMSELVAEVRRISRGLFPVELDEQDLPAALDNLAREVEELFNASCHTRLSEGIRFSPETEVHILRIAQELITNAVKHGGASHFHLGLRCTRRGVEMSIDHDGTAPITGESGRYGLGLRSLEYRVRAIDATLETRLSADGRTRTTCRMPL